MVSARRSGGGWRNRFQDGFGVISAGAVTAGMGPSMLRLRGMTVPDRRTRHGLPPLGQTGRQDRRVRLGRDPV